MSDDEFTVCNPHGRGGTMNDKYRQHLQASTTRKVASIAVINYNSRGLVSDPDGPRERVAKAMNPA